MSRASFLSLLCFAFAPALATAAQSYTVTDLGVPAGADDAEAIAVNASGQVGGTYLINGERHVFLWQNGVLRDLQGLSVASNNARAMNGLGQLTGDSSPRPESDHAVIFSTSSPVDLGRVLGPIPSQGFGINDAGQVVGQASSRRDVNGLSSFAFLYSAGKLSRLIMSGGDEVHAAAINNAGQMAGWASITGANGAIHAVLWTDGRARDLGTLPGDSGSSAQALNDLGEVIGLSARAGSYYPQAFLYSGGVMRAIPAPGFTELDVTAINNRGQVVGIGGLFQTGTHGALFSDGVTNDLNTLIPADSGWVITQARGINDAGQIAAVGIPAGGDKPRALLLTPR